MRRTFACAAALAAIATSGLAQPRPELDGPSQLEMNQQAGERLRIADKELNAVYAKLMAAASPDGKTRLRASQRAWIQFRDLDCEARAGSRDGSFYPASRALCLEGATDERTATLKIELACEEGDVSCGGTTE